MFEDGNAIVNVYAADARKLSSFYTRQVTPDFAPRDMTTKNLLERVTALPQKAPATIEEQTWTHYIGNFEYIFKDEQTTRIHNIEGYFESGQYFYYRKDHLGNNREVWNATQRQTVQITNYYPSGLPWAYETDVVQPYMYNGKEFIEMDYDCYTYGFRDYYAAIGRFTSIDPMAEGTYWQSTYSYANNNPIRNIDWMGLSASTTSNSEQIKDLLNHLAGGGSADDYDFSDWDDVDVFKKKHDINDYSTSKRPWICLQTRRLYFSVNGGCGPDDGACITGYSIYLNDKNLGDLAEDGDFSSWDIFSDVNNGMAFVLSGASNAASRALKRSLAYTNSASATKMTETLIKTPLGNVFVSKKQ